MAQIGSVTAVLNADSSGFAGGIGQAVDALGSLGSMLGTTRGGIAALGAAGAAVAVGGLAAATTQAAEFERTIAGAAARAGATQQAFNAFGQSARKASLDSAFGANEAGGALRYLAKSGFEVQEATAALPGILQGATAAGMGAAEMGEIASNALRQFGREASETEEVMDVLVAASTSANTSVQELGQGMSIVGGLASEAGMSIEETSALFASLQDAGIGASRAATAMRAGISRLLKPTSEANSALERLGVNVKTTDGEFRGMIDIIADLESAGASAEDMLSIFGRRAGPTLQTALSQGGESLKAFESQMHNADGTSREIAEFIRSSLTEQLNVLWGSLETLGANIGSFVLPALKGLTLAMQGVVEVLNFAVDVIKGILIPLGEFAGFLPDASEETDKLSEAAGGASEKLGEIDTRFREGKQGAQDFEEAQRGVNDAVKDFNDLDIEGKRSAFDRLAEDARNLQGVIDSAQGRLELLEATFESRTGIPAEQADPVAFQGDPLFERMQAAREQVENLRVGQEELERKITDAATAATTLTEEEQKQLKSIRMGTAALQAQSDRQEIILKSKQRIAEIESNETLPSQIKAAKVEQERVRRNKRLADLKKEQAEADQEMTRAAIEESLDGDVTTGGAGGQVVDFGGQTAGVSGMGVGPGRTQQDPFGKEAQRNFAKARREDEAHSAAAKGPSAAEAEEALAQQRQEGISAAQDMAGQVTGLASALMKAGGASSQAQQALGGVGGALQSVLGGIASGGPAGIASGVIGGITSLVGGLMGGGAGDTSPGRYTRQNEDLAKRIAKHNADEMEKRGLQPVELNIAGRAGGTERGPGGIEQTRGQRDDMQEADALEGVG